MPPKIDLTTSKKEKKKQIWISHNFEMLNPLVVALRSSSSSNQLHTQQRFRDSSLWRRVTVELPRVADGAAAPGSNATQNGEALCRTLQSLSTPPKQSQGSHHQQGSSSRTSSSQQSVDEEPVVVVLPPGSYAVSSRSGQQMTVRRSAPLLLCGGGAAKEDVHLYTIDNDTTTAKKKDACPIVWHCELLVQNLTIRGPWSLTPQPHSPHGAILYPALSGYECLLEELFVPAVCCAVFSQCDIASTKVDGELVVSDCTLGSELSTSNRVAVGEKGKLTVRHSTLMHTRLSTAIESVSILEHCELLQCDNTLIQGCSLFDDCAVEHSRCLTVLHFGVLTLINSSIVGSGSGGKAKRLVAAEAMSTLRVEKCSFECLALSSDLSNTCIASLTSGSVHVSGCLITLVGPDDDEAPPPRGRGGDPTEGLMCGIFVDSTPTTAVVTGTQFVVQKNVGNRRRVRGVVLGLWNEVDCTANTFDSAMKPEDCYSDLGELFPKDDADQQSNHTRRSEAAAFAKPHFTKESAPVGIVGNESLQEEESIELDRSPSAASTSRVLDLRAVNSKSSMPPHHHLAQQQQGPSGSPSVEREDADNCADNCAQSGHDNRDAVSSWLNSPPVAEAPPPPSSSPSVSRDASAPAERTCTRHPLDSAKASYIAPTPQEELQKLAEEEQDESDHHNEQAALRTVHTCVAPLGLTELLDCRSPDSEPFAATTEGPPQFDHTVPTAAPTPTVAAGGGSEPVLVVVAQQQHSPKHQQQPPQPEETKEEAALTTTTADPPPLRQERGPSSNPPPVVSRKNSASSSLRSSARPVLLLEASTDAAKAEEARKGPLPPSPRSEGSRIAALEAEVAALRQLLVGPQQQQSMMMKEPQPPTPTKKHSKKRSSNSSKSRSSKPSSSSAAAKPGDVAPAPPPKKATSTNSTKQQHQQQPPLHSNSVTAQDDRPPSPVTAWGDDEVVIGRHRWRKGLMPAFLRLEVPLSEVRRDRCDHNRNSPQQRKKNNRQNGKSTTNDAEEEANHAPNEEPPNPARMHDEWLEKKRERQRERLARTGETPTRKMTPSEQQASNERLYRGPMEHRENTMNKLHHEALLRSTSPRQLNVYGELMPTVVMTEDDRLAFNERLQREEKDRKDRRAMLLKRYVPKEVRVVKPSAETIAYCASLHRSHQDDDAAQQAAQLCGQPLHVVSVADRVREQVLSRSVTPKVISTAERDAYCESLYRSHKDEALANRAAAVSRSESVARVPHMTSTSPTPPAMMAPVAAPSSQHKPTRPLSARTRPASATLIPRPPTRAE